MEKVVYIKAYFLPLLKEVSVKVSTGETKKGFFGEEKEIKRTEKQFKRTGWSDTKVDGKRLAEDLESSIKNLNSEGYFVKAITPIISGTYNYKSQGISSSTRVLRETEAVRGGASYGYGYSYTDSLIIVASKNA